MHYWILFMVVFTTGRVRCQFISSIFISSYHIFISLLIVEVFNGYSFCQNMAAVFCTEKSSDAKLSFGIHLLCDNCFMTIMSLIPSYIANSWGDFDHRIICFPRPFHHCKTDIKCCISENRFYWHCSIESPMNRQKNIEHATLPEWHCGEFSV